MKRPDGALAMAMAVAAFAAFGGETPADERAVLETWAGKA